MKSFTGKIASGRGWVLLLALMLGAGMFISACGDEEVPAPTTPTPPPAPPPAPEPEPEPEPEGPATPENLRVAATTSNSITWTWDAVEGVLGYQGQFSPDDTFTDTDATFIIPAPLTSHTVSNLSGNMTGHFRVRSGVGAAVTDLTFSEWTEGVSGTTAPPPAAAALDAPGDVTTSATDDSVTVSWDEVDDAESYEVEYRLAGAGGNWNDADCGDDGIVDGTSCVVDGLDEGTDYEFRVRGLPADDDEAHTAGEWAEVDETTTGAREVAVSGGMGDLNVTWESTADTITFSWEPMSGARYEWEVLTTFSDAANPCADTAFTTSTNKGGQFSVTIDSLTTAGTIQGLCVRLEDEDLDDEEKALSWAWGVNTPDAPTNTVGTPTIDDRRRATTLDWGDIELKEGLEWELRIVADSGRDNGELSGAPGKSVQDACGAGTFVDQGDADLDLTINYTWDGAINPYTGYLLCLKYANTAGSSEWVVPNNGTSITEIYTPPAAPPAPQFERGTNDAGGNNRTLVWTVPNRDSANVPRRAVDFEAKSIRYPVRYDHDGLDTTNMVSTPAPTSCDADDLNAGPSNFTGTTNPWSVQDETETDDLEGIRVTTSTAIVIPDNAAENLNVRLCVRANKNSAGGDLVGPWVIGGNTTVTKKPAS